MITSVVTGIYMALGLLGAVLFAAALPGAYKASVAPPRNRAVYEYDPDGIYTYKHQNPRFK